MSEHECCNSDICCHCGTSLEKDSQKRPDPFIMKPCIGCAKTVEEGVRIIYE